MEELDTSIINIFNHGKLSDRSGYPSGKESCDDMHFGKCMLVSGSPSITEQKHHPAARMDKTQMAGGNR